MKVQAIGNTTVIAERIITGSKSERSIAVYKKLGYKLFKTEKFREEESTVFVFMDHSVR
jgi:RimJ/RimL family protein N-acetyltransferase